MKISKVTDYAALNNCLISQPNICCMFYCMQPHPSTPAINFWASFTRLGDQVLISILPKNHADGDK